MVETNWVWYFSLGLLLGFIAGSAVIGMLLSAVMLSSSISQRDEEDMTHEHLD